MAGSVARDLGESPSGASALNAGVLITAAGVNFLFSDAGGGVAVGVGTPFGALLGDVFRYIGCGPGDWVMKPVEGRFFPIRSRATLVSATRRAS